MGHTKRNFGGGRIWLDGREVRYGSPAQAVATGIAYVSEDRKLDGFFETLGVADNIGLGWLAKFGRGRLFAPLAQDAAVCRANGSDRLAIRSGRRPTSRRSICPAATSRRWSSPSRWPRSRALSFSTSRPAAWMSARSPEIRQIIRDFADRGAGVILISSYLPEILDLSDRILVAKCGTIAAEFARGRRAPRKFCRQRSTEEGSGGIAQSRRPFAQRISAVRVDDAPGGDGDDRLS